MFCINCGKQIIDTARFCNYCGSAVIREEEPILRDIPQSLPNDEVSPASEAAVCSIQSAETEAISDENSVSSAEFAEKAAVDGGVEFTQQTAEVKEQSLFVGKDEQTENSQTAEPIFASSGAVGFQNDGTIPNAQTVPQRTEPQKSGFAVPDTAAVQNNSTAVPQSNSAPRMYTIGHIIMCLASTAIMAIAAGVFAGLYFSVV